MKQPVAAPVEHPATALGNWYATALFWKPQVALFVNERTLLPVFVPLAPAAKLARRFPDQLGRVLEGMGTPIDFILQEIGAMGHASYSKTVNRSVVGSMNDFAFLQRPDGPMAKARTWLPCRFISPELHVARCG